MIQKGEQITLLETRLRMPLVSHHDILKEGPFYGGAF